MLSASTSAEPPRQNSDDFNEITGQVYNIFLLFFSGDRDYIKSICSVSAVRPLQYTGA